MRNRGTPRSASRVTEEAASFVWSVERTRCPVRAAWTAISAVSGSRISPTIRMSGSCRRTLRIAAAKVNSIRGWTCTWLSPGWTNSTGSSMVITFTSGVATCRSTE